VVFGCKDSEFQARENQRGGHANRRLSLTVVGQSAVSYSWDNANRLTRITQGTNSVSFSYDAANRRTELTLPNGVTLAYSYDQDSRVSGMTWTLGGNQVGDLSYSYDADGRVIAKSGSFAQTNLPQAVTSNTFNADNEMTAFNGTTLSYDLNGNLTSDGTNTYTWDARNHLSGISGGTTAAFVYDAFGRRAGKTLGVNTTQFVYDGLNPVQELDGANPANVTANLLTGLSIDEYFARADSNGAMNFLTDALGSTLALADSSGALNTSYTYEPFGNTTVGGSNPNPYQFTGRENDGTGLYFYRARYYSPTFQRFIAQDPSGFVRGGPNVYAYVSNNPLSFLDPFGLQAVANPVPNPEPTSGPPRPPARSCPSSGQPGPTTLSCFAGKVGDNPIPLIECALGAGVCIYTGNAYVCVGASIGCIDLLGQLGECYQNPRSFP
jgi:RHS repeat-associated protein